MAQGKHFLPKGRNRKIAKKNQTQARLKPSRANIKSLSSLSNTLFTLWHGVSFKVLAWASLYHLAYYSPSWPLSWASSAVPCGFPLQEFHVPGTSYFWGLHLIAPASFSQLTITLSGASCGNSVSSCMLPGFPGFPFKSRQRLL